MINLKETIVEIYYFSGTGNSMHIAKELSNRIPKARLIPLVSLLADEVISSTAEIVGFGKGGHPSIIK